MTPLDLDWRTVLTPTAPWVRASDVYECRGCKGASGPKPGPEPTAAREGSTGNTLHMAGRGYINSNHSLDNMGHMMVTTGGPQLPQLHPP